MPKTKKERSSYCPLCGCISGTILQIFNSKNAVTHIYGNDTNKNSNYLTKHIENLWNANTCFYILCENCSLAYASPFIAGDSSFYQTIYNKPIGYSKWKWEFQATFDKILQINTQTISSPNTLLEIGAGNGNFIKKLSEATILPHNILTTEFSLYGKSEIEKLLVI